MNVPRTKAIITAAAARRKALLSGGWSDAQYLNNLMTIPFD
jgi:hypothetical protein